MVVIRLFGGLGNQMFQYAFGKSLALERHCELKIDLTLLDKSKNHPNITYRNLDLDIFELNIELLNKSSLSLKRLVAKKIRERNFTYDGELVTYLESLPKGKMIFITGYWQSPKYFNHFLKDIKSSFEFKNALYGKWKIMANLIDSTQSVMINVRRTDYLNLLDIHGVVTLEYLLSSIEIIKTKYSEPTFFIFSDDIPWCRCNLPDKSNFIYVDEEYYDNKYQYYLHLMSRCKHFIISNSTFAWWAAFLGQDSNSTVIAPREWFQTKKIDAKDLIPETWLRVGMKANYVPR